MKRDTLIWRLATVYGGLSDRGKDKERTIDICNLMRCVLTGVWHVFLILLVALVMSIVLGDLLAWAAAIVVTSAFVTPNPPAVLGIAFFLLVVLFLAVYLGGKAKDKLRECWPEAKNANADDAEPSLISTYIQSIKDKVCYTVRVEPLEHEK